MKFQVFGIRHHGPGSAKNLKRALEHYQPDAMLVEGPPDANGIIPYMADFGLKPPVAILLYNPKDLSQAAYFPFAKFSPEWQAILYALKRNISVEFMDLPHSMNFTLDKLEAAPEQQLTLDIFKDEPQTLDAPIIKDPLSHMASIAGYQDSERWWEVTFEHIKTTEEIFPAILELMIALREELDIPEKPREQMREAYMRKLIRAKIRKHQKVAVVCGAWHSPALHFLKKYKVKNDNAILKGIKKTKTRATWIPWTYERLSYQSGYGAGVLSPAWYQLLFSNRKHVVVRWMTQVAKLLRTEDLDASSAHVIEAVRLAETLATLRALPLPGIEELEEAAKTIFCGGYEEPMVLIREKLIIGDEIGKVPKSIPVVPLQADLEKQVKTARLSKEYQNAETTNKQLDLRKPTNFTASLLLHRLNLLKIDWGKQQMVAQTKLGSFHENWKLQWKVGFPLAIIEAGIWGNTVLNAATNFVQKTAKETDKLEQLTDLVDKAIDADLQAAIPELTFRLKSLAALTKDVRQLMQSLPKLVNKLRYGTVRKIDLSSIETVVYEIIPRIFISLPSACQSINEEATKGLFHDLQATNRVISLLNDPIHLREWHQVLHQIAHMKNVNGILTGGCSRILFDRQEITIEKTVEHMRFSLSQANSALAAAHWIEGFLHGSGLLLIHNPSLWNILDEWVAELDMIQFTDLLPLLRRTFSEFPTPERQKMMDLAKKRQIQTSQTDKAVVYDEVRVAKVLPTVRLLLGL